MGAALGVAVGLLAGLALAAFLMQHSECCASLGAAGLKKAGLPDLGAGPDSVFGGAISALGLT